MRLPFLNRQKEITALEWVLKGSEPAFIVVYGRRRCGKSRLLQHVSGKRDIYFLADQQETPLQIQTLAQEIKRVVPGFAAVQYPSWDALLITLNERVKKNTSLILDEFPYLVQSTPELPSIIQRFLDSPADKNFNLIICGSSQRMMRGLVLDAAAPLYGRARLALKISPLPPGLIGDALALDSAEAIKAYALWGGVPRYWELARDCKTLDAGMQQLILDKNGILHEEPMRLLLDDMRSAAQPYSILMLIGNGCHRLSEIAGRLGKPAGSLTRPLATLIDLGYIRRELPYGESLRSTKRTLYKINEPFLQFYFDFVLPNKSLLEMGLTEKVFTNIRSRLSKHIAAVWEELARLSVPHLDTGGIQWGPAGRWWGTVQSNRQVELDIVAESLDRKTLLIGEAKWDESANIERTAAKLQNTAEGLPFIRGRRIVTACWLKQMPHKKTAHTIITPQEVLQCLR